MYVQVYEGDDFVRGPWSAKQRRLPYSMQHSSSSGGRCAFLCWRNESGLPGNVLWDKGFSCDRGRFARCGGCQAYQERRPTRVDGTTTHAIVIATRFDRASPEVEAMVLRHRDSARKLSVQHAAIVVVDNGSPEQVAATLRIACSRTNISYARNEAWAQGYGYELGAWRWAVQRALPSIVPPLASDAIIYFVQDSLTLQPRAALTYPPPLTFEATCLITFRPSGNRHPVLVGAGLSVNESDAIVASAVRAALAKLRGAVHAEQVRPSSSFVGCFGPNVVMSWRGARRLEQRGFFEMLRVRSKREEQLAERITGYVFTHALQPEAHAHVHVGEQAASWSEAAEAASSPCSVAGDLTSHLTLCAAARRCQFWGFEKHYRGRTGCVAANGSSC